MLTDAFEGGLLSACTGPGPGSGGGSASLSRLLSTVAEVVPPSLPQYDLTADAGFEAAVSDLAGALTWRGRHTSACTPCSGSSYR